MRKISAVPARALSGTSASHSPLFAGAVNSTEWNDRPSAGKIHLVSGQHETTQHASDPPIGLAFSAPSNPTHGERAYPTIEDFDYMHGSTTYGGGLN